MGACFDDFFFVVMGDLLACHQKNYESSPPEVKITFFTLFYIYIILHDHVKSYKYIYFIPTLFYMALNKFTSFYTYTNVNGY